MILSESDYERNLSIKVKISNLESEKLQLYESCDSQLTKLRDKSSKLESRINNIQYSIMHKSNAVVWSLLIALLLSFLLALPVYVEGKTDLTSKGIDDHEGVALIVFLFIFPVTLFLAWGMSEVNISYLRNLTWDPVGMRFLLERRAEKRSRKLDEKIQKLLEETGIDLIDKRLSRLRTQRENSDRELEQIVCKYVSKEKTIQSHDRELEEINKLENELRDLVGEIIQLDNRLIENMPLDLVISDVQKLSEGQLNKYVIGILEGEDHLTES